MQLDTNWFWNILEDASKSEGANLDCLRERLSTATNDELETFREFQEIESNRFFTWSLWNAHYLLNGYSSDDTFLYWRFGILLQGDRKLVDDIVKEPDLLANVHLREMSSGGAFLGLCDSECSRRERAGLTASSLNSWVKHFTDEPAGDKVPYVRAIWEELYPGLLAKLDTNYKKRLLENLSSIVRQ